VASNVTVRQYKIIHTT